MLAATHFIQAVEQHETPAFWVGEFPPEGVFNIGTASILCSGANKLHYVNAIVQFLSPSELG